MSQIRTKPGQTGTKRRAAENGRAKATDRFAPIVVAEAPPEVKRPIDRNWIAWAVAILVAGLWAYWPTLVEIVKVWNREADYSHGFLIVPLAIVFLFVRRASYPGIGKSYYPLGLGLLGLGLLTRYLSARFYYEFLDGYSILFWMAGAVEILGGRRLLLWAAPSIAFLFFMIPLPFGIETMLSGPLQRIATKLTCFILQTLGYSAFAEGNVVWLGDLPLFVERACSGLRLFMTIVALAYSYIVLVRPAWWESAVLVGAVVPIAILSNAMRIVLVGIIDLYTSLSHTTVDKYVGIFFMIPLAALMFAGVLWYLSKLIRENEVMDMAVLVRDAD
jgi:exosortase